MSLSGNFQSLDLGEKTLTVGGSSEELVGGSLIARHVAVQQGSHIDKGDASTQIQNWDATLSSAGFKAGVPALCLGAETWFLETEVPETGDKLPSFVTLTWSQTLTIQKG